MPILNAGRNKTLRKRAAWLICANLVLILLALVGQEYLYLQSRPSAAEAPVSLLPPGWPENLPDIRPLAPPGLWKRHNLSDKINGKAELYLAAGFVNMHSCRYALRGQDDKFFEVQLFEQDSPQNAFAVFSQQRRSQGVPLDWIEHGYSSSNALYLQQGSYYLEMTGVSAEAGLRQAMEAWARAWLSQQASGGPLPIDFFPGEGLRAGSVMLLAKDAFGLAGFDQVWVAQYLNLMLFVCHISDAGPARRQLDDLKDFWSLQGAVPLEDPDMSAFELEGRYELFMLQGEYLLGVHEAASLQEGRLMLSRLRRHLAEK